MPHPFRVIALISAFNEADIISPVIEHLVENGVDAYLLDNCSTDDTRKEAERWLGKGLIGLETFPRPEDERYHKAAERYDWTAILLRKEELATTLEADWFLHHDADEIRESPWEGLSLKDAIQFVDSLDYNCIDFRIFDFPPTDNGFRRGFDPKTYFTHCRDAQSFDQVQLKCWKSRGPVSLVRSGGHDVGFEGRRVFPIPFLLRHYPIRSQQHGVRKVFDERKRRFAPEERAKSWHIQYDHIGDEQHPFVVDPESLRPFDLRRARLDVMLRNRDAAESTKQHATAIADLESQLAAAAVHAVAARDEERDRQAHEFRARLDAFQEQLAGAKEAAALAAQLERARGDLERAENEGRRQVDQLSAQLVEARQRLEAAEAERQTERARLEHTHRELAERLALSTEQAAAASSRAAGELLELGAAKIALEARAAAQAADLDRAHTELGETQTALSQARNDFARTHHELAAAYASRTWRWGEPVGRFIQSLGFMRARRQPPTAAAPRPSAWRRGVRRIFKGASDDAIPDAAQGDAPDSAEGQAKQSSVPAPPLSRASRYSILAVSYYCPTRAHAGGLRILDLYALIRTVCPGARLDLYTHHRPTIDGPVPEIYTIFDNVYLSPNEDLNPAGLRSLGCDESHYDVADLQFHHVGKHIGAYKGIARKVLFTPMESMVRALFTNLRMAFTRSKRYSLASHRQIWLEAWEERTFCREADETICVSRPDAQCLKAVAWFSRVRAIETGLSTLEFGDVLGLQAELHPGLKAQRVLYVAYFGSETNVSALRWYLDNVHPIVRRDVPGYVLTVVGRGDLSPFERYRLDESIEWVGEVADIAPEIERARVGIAPAVAGSGFRGKINQYAAFGVPTVASPISAHGLAYTDGVDIFVAASPDQFAARSVQLLTDASLNARMGSAARRLCMERYTWASKIQEVRDVYNVPEAYAHQPRITALVPSYNHGRFIQQRIESILSQTYRNIELIVIDDRSDDDSDAIIRGLVAKHHFTYIRNDANSGSPFTAWSRGLSLATGDFIWICESDDFAEPEFLSKAVAALARTPGAVLFYSNSWVVDDANRRVDSTSSYFHDIWKETRWDGAFSADGCRELTDFQLRGQTVPNMSSAVIAATAFREAYRPFLKRLKLTGDWLFIGDLLSRGRVVFTPEHLSNFRRHDVTARARVKSARSQAEFILTKYLLFRQAARPIRDFAPLMASDAIRFLYEPARWFDVLRSLFGVSSTATLRCGALLAVSVLMNHDYAAKWFERYEQVKGAS